MIKRIKNDLKLNNQLLVNHHSKINNIKYGATIAKTLTPNHLLRKIGHPSCKNPNKAPAVHSILISSDILELKKRLEEDVYPGNKLPIR